MYHCAVLKFFIARPFKIYKNGIFGVKIYHLATLFAT
jgi:hypothetical protein